MHLRRLSLLLAGWLAACAPASAGAPPTPTVSGARPTAKAASPAPTPFPAAPIPAGAASEFTTDFTRSSVSLEEILSGGPPKDGIPALDAPRFVSVAEADAWLQAREPVVLVAAGGVTRAYPLQILTWHEIVNDVVGGVPLTVTFCPLCNTAIAFERTVAGQVLDFGATGRLRYSNLIMYDRQTETWWQQATGEAIVGALTGAQLTLHPAAIVAWADFKAAAPAGEVLSRETGFDRAYGVNPYTGYDAIDNRPWLYQGPETPGRLPPMARVLTLVLNGAAAAYPYDVLKQWRAVNDKVGGVDVAVFWQPGAASALDAAALAEGREVGAALAFESRLDGRWLSFRYVEGRLIDNETGSTWTALGAATAGALAGRQLTPAASAVNHFWFSWAAFRPETRVYTYPP